MAQTPRSLRVPHIDGLATSAVIPVEWVGGVRLAIGVPHGRSTGRIGSVGRGREWMSRGRHGVLYTRAGRRGWVWDAEVHRRGEDGGGVGPTVVN